MNTQKPLANSERLLFIRIGMYVLLTFMEINGAPIDPTEEEVARVGFAVAAGTMNYEDLLEWIRENR